MRYENLSVIEMSVENWILVPDNPIQRNTESHAEKAKKAHLKKYSTTQIRVAAAILPDASLFKLDGHTRAYLWEKHLLPRPEKVIVDLYQILKPEDAIELYQHYDTASAAELSRDKLYGAYRENQFTPQSDLIKHGGLTNAFATIFNKKPIDIYAMVRTFKGALETIDRQDFSRRKFPSPILGAAILSLHCEGDEAIGFWLKYQNDEGVKQGNLRDGVQSLTETMMSPSAKGRSSLGANRYLLAQALACLKAYRENRTSTKIGAASAVNIDLYLKANLKE